MPEKRVHIKFLIRKRTSSGQISPQIGIILAVIAVIVSISIVAGYFYFRPNFEITDLLVPSSVEPGEDIIISAIVKNTGRMSGTHEITLKIDNLSFQPKSVELSGGENELVDFRVLGYRVGEGKQIGVGTHQVKVDGQTATFRVLEPAKFEVRNLEINPREVEPGENVYISVSVMNAGEIEDIATIALKIGGEVEATGVVMLAGGAEKKVSFTVVKENEGTYGVEVGGLSGSFKVAKRERPSTVTIIVIGVFILSLFIFVKIAQKKARRRR